MNCDFQEPMILYSVISPKPIDQEQEQNFVGMIIAILTTIILLLVAIILFIIARNKSLRRAEAINSFGLTRDTCGIDKRVFQLTQFLSINMYLY